MYSGHCQCKLLFSVNVHGGRATPSRQLLGRQSEATQVHMQGNVKHGGYLRTLGGAMTAQCKVLHLLFSQSDYPKGRRVSHHFNVRVVFYSCDHRQALAVAIRKQETTAVYIPLSFLQADQRSTSHWNDTEGVDFVISRLVGWTVFALTDCCWILCLPPQIHLEFSPS